MIPWQPFEHEGVSYDLAHLHPYVYQFEQAAKGEQPARSYVVQVFFSLHCFTRSAKEPGELRGPLAYADHRETRLFDFKRYVCSKQLRDIVVALPSAPCFHTQHGNFFTLKGLNPQTGQEEDYEVYFVVSKSSRRPAMLNLFVQSAYIRDQHHINKPRRKKINFFVILHNVLHGKAIKAAPK